MPYATQAQMLEQEGEDTVYAAFDRDRDQVLDSAAISIALEEASGTIDSYLSMRFDLPLATPPVWAKRICIDLAIYYGSRSADALTREITKRYEDDIAFLERVGAGKAGLGLPVVSQPAGPDDGVVKGEILVECEPRLFNRRTQQP